MCSIGGVIPMKTVDPDEVMKLVAILGGDLQHRGHEWLGFAHSDGRILRVYKQAGLFESAFGNREVYQSLRADTPQLMCLQGRFSTQGRSTKRNAQPQFLRPGRGTIALGSNGDHRHYAEARRELEEQGLVFDSQNDAELLVQHILYHADNNFDRLEDGIRHLMLHSSASFSSWLATRDTVHLFRDRFANRPLFYMTVGDYFVFASEDCALNGILTYRAEEGHQDGTVSINQVLPGEMLTVHLHDPQIVRQQLVEPEERRALCLFEYVYFQRPDSRFRVPTDGNPLCYKIMVQWDNGNYWFDYLEDQTEEVNSFRYRLGKQLAAEHPMGDADADCVISIPASGDLAAAGFADESGLAYRIGLVRNPYVSQTFISPELSNRKHLASIKYRPMHALFTKRPRIVVVDDSIVYGTSIQRLVRTLRAAGAKEIHVRISCPPVVERCPYGIDMATKGDLIAATMAIEKIEREHLRVSSLRYLSLEGLLKVAGKDARHFCTGCWSKELRI